MPMIITVAGDEAVGGSVDNIANLGEADAGRDLVDELVGRGEDITGAASYVRALISQ